MSRLGNPLINEVVVPAGLKDAFNAIPPGDATAAGGKVVDRVLDPEVPRVIQGIYGIEPPAPPRYDLFEVFLTGIATARRWTSTGPVDAEPDRRRPELAGAQRRSGDQFQPSEMLRLNMSITGPTGWTASR